MTQLVVSRTTLPLWAGSILLVVLALHASATTSIRLKDENPLLSNTTLGLTTAALILVALSQSAFQIYQKRNKYRLASQNAGGRAAARTSAPARREAQASPKDEFDASDFSFSGSRPSPSAAASRPSAAPRETPVLRAPPTPAAPLTASRRVPCTSCGTVLDVRLATGARYRCPKCSTIGVAP